MFYLNNFLFKFKLSKSDFVVVYLSLSILHDFRMAEHLIYIVYIPVDLKHKLT